MNSQPPSWNYTVVTLAVVMLAAFFWLCYVKPAYYLLLITIEDGWGDYATSVSYGIAALLYLTLVMQSKVWVHRTLFFLLALSCVFIGGEEISWGQRLFSYPVPEFFRSINYQNEVSIHNTEYFDSSFVKYLLSIVIMFWAALSVVCALFRTDRMRVFSFVQPFLFPLSLMPLFLIFPLIFLLSPLPRSDEVNELSLALAAVVWALSLYLGYQPKRQSSGPRSLVALAVLFIVIVGLSGVLRYKKGYNVPDARWLLNYSMAVSFRDAQLQPQIEAIYGYICENQEYANYDTDVNFALFLLQQGRTVRAREILAESSDSCGNTAAGASTRAESYRVMGLRYALSEQPEKAASALARAIGEDEARLGVAVASEEIARLLWSLARSKFVEDADVAIKHAKTAIEVSDSAQHRQQVGIWVRCSTRARLTRECFQWPEIVAKPYV